MVFGLGHRRPRRWRLPLPPPGPRPRLLRTPWWRSRARDTWRRAMPTCYGGPQGLWKRLRIWSSNAGVRMRPWCWIGWASKVGVTGRSGVVGLERNQAHRYRFQPPLVLEPLSINHGFATGTTCSTFPFVVLQGYGMVCPTVMWNL